MYINKRISLRLYLYILFFFDSPATSRARAISSWRWTYYILNGGRKTNLRRQRIRAQTYYYYNYHYTRVYNSASVEEARGRDGSGSAPVRHATRRGRLIVFFFLFFTFLPKFLPNEYSADNDHTTYSVRRIIVYHLFAAGLCASRTLECSRTTSASSAQCPAITAVIFCQLAIFCTTYYYCVTQSTHTRCGEIVRNDNMIKARNKSTEMFAR